MLLFFTAGMLACASIVHWLFFPAGVDSDYHNVFHMIPSIQGFLTCLIAACCFYFIPKVTDIPSPKNGFWAFWHLWAQLFLHDYDLKRNMVFSRLIKRIF